LEEYIEQFSVFFIFKILVHPKFFLKKSGKSAKIRKSEKIQKIQNPKKKISLRI
jgi:hypothetical protein